MKYYFLLFGSFLLVNLNGQDSTTRAAILQPITELFGAMQRGEAASMAHHFHPEAHIVSFQQKEKGVETRRVSAGDFLARLGTPEPGSMLEEIHFAEIRQDGELATAWTPYTFVYQGKVSHCGTNSIQLILNPATQKWQIYQITYNRRTENCVRVAGPTATERINQLADNWHQAATDADGEAYFKLMADKSIFIGTDATEHWDKAAFQAFAMPYFKKGKAWDFKKIERHVFVNPDENIAYWDELLDTWMGPCRGTGIAQRQADGSYLIKHYTLSVTIDNDKIQGFIELTLDKD